MTSPESWLAADSRRFSGEGAQNCLILDVAQRIQQCMQIVQNDYTTARTFYVVLDIHPQLLYAKQLHPATKHTYTDHFRTQKICCLQINQKLQHCHPEKTKTQLEIWGRAQREAARGVRKQALINF